MPRPPTSVALIGHRGTGKTTVGARLAVRLGLAFADADAELQQRLGTSIAQLFASGREAVFRDEEERTIAELTRRSGLVLATGGGAVLREASRRALKAFGPVIWLRAEVQVLTDRLARDPIPRPALSSAGLLAEIQTILAEREPIYRSLADLAIDTSRLNPAEVVDEIERQLVLAHRS